MSKAKLNSLMTDLKKKFGEEAVMWGSEVPVGRPVSTGVLGLDFATSYGGFPSDRVVEICGEEGTGKTTLALLTMLNALDRNPTKAALFLDVEHKVTPDWLELIVGKEFLGGRVIYIQPTSIEQATNIYRQAVSSGLICCAILDSIGGAPTVRRNDDAEVGHYGGNAIGVGEFARSAATMSATHSCLTIGINQTRADMSGYHGLNTPGGRAWKHAVILRIELVKGKETETVTLPGEQKPVPIGYTIWAKVRKNQVGPPGRTAMYWFYNVWTEEHGFGVDVLDEIARLGIKTKVLTRNGGWYHHPALPTHAPSGEHKVQGMSKVKELIKIDEALRKTLASEILAAAASYASDVAPMTDPDAPIEISPLVLDGEEQGE